jgi:alginate O-acetyltransferase complex protein AlgI
MFGFSGSGPVSGEALYYLRSYGPMLVIMILASTPVLKHIHQKIPRRLAGIAVPVLIVVFMVLSTAYLVDSSYNPFLYFRF